MGMPQKFHALIFGPPQTKFPSAAYDVVVAVNETVLSFNFRSSEDDDLPSVHFASNVGEEVLMLYQQSLEESGQVDTE